MPGDKIRGMALAAGPNLVRRPCSVPNHFSPIIQELKYRMHGVGAKGPELPAGFNAHIMVCGRPSLKLPCAQG